jgi:hypothetical protein
VRGTGAMLEYGVLTGQGPCLLMGFGNESKFVSCLVIAV